jgi:uncharacterized protein YigE (DUF2233 family)
MRITIILLSLAQLLFPLSAEYFVKKPSGFNTPLPHILMDRVLWSAGDAYLAKYVQWEKKGDGMALGEIHIERRDTTGTKIFLLRIDPKKYGFRVIGEPGAGKAVEEWAKEEACAAAINGGYFYLKGREESKVPLGLTVKGGREFARYRENYSGCFFVSDEGPGFVMNEKPKGKPAHVIQSFPMLVFNGRIPDVLKKEDKDKLHIHRRHRCSAVGTDWNGNIVFVITALEASYFEMAFLSGALGLKTCLALDGGASSQMAVLTNPPALFPGLDAVPMGLGAWKKQGK